MLPKANQGKNVFIFRELFQNYKTHITIYKNTVEQSHHMHNTDHTLFQKIRGKEK